MFGKTSSHLNTGVKQHWARKVPPPLVVVSHAVVCPVSDRVSPRGGTTSEDKKFLSNGEPRSGLSHDLEFLVHQNLPV